MFLLNKIIILVKITLIAIYQMKYTYLSISIHIIIKFNNNLINWTHTLMQLIYFYYYIID